MAFNFLKSLVSSDLDNNDSDNISSSVDDLEGDYDDESDIELDSLNLRLVLHLISIVRRVII